MTAEGNKTGLSWEWLGSAVLGEKLRDIYFCKITVPNGKVLFGYLTDRTDFLLIPMKQRDKVPESLPWMRDNDSNLREKRQLYEYLASRLNSQQLPNTGDAREIYKALGTHFTMTHDNPPHRYVETSTLGSGYGWNLYIRDRSYSSQESGLGSVIETIGNGLGWKIEPVSNEEYMSLTG